MTDPREPGRQPEPHLPDSGRRMRWGLVATVGLAAALIALALQNTDTVTIEWLWWDFRAPLVIVLLVTAIAAIALSELVGFILRRRKRRRLAEEEELRRLRDEAPDD